MNMKKKIKYNFHSVPDWGLYLSFTILKFFIWQPGWDNYLTNTMNERLKNNNNK